MQDAARARRWHVRVYAGAGASAHAVAYTLDGLRAELAPALAVSEVQPEELVAGGWEACTGAAARVRRLRALRVAVARA
jgi:hypothetical protein